MNPLRIFIVDMVYSRLYYSSKVYHLILPGDLHTHIDNYNNYMIIVKQ